MAIFIASTKSISRGSGQSAVASASYRAGIELEDLRYGKTHDYSKRSGVMSADIILPSVLAAANADIDRADLWNKAEAVEKRKDARVAREWLVNLPYELSEDDRKELAHSFAQTLADRYGTIADCAIHKPTDKEVARGADPRNFHAHILFTTRCAEIDDNNEIVLTDKATIELSDNKRRSLGMERVSYEIKEVRQLWEQIANEKLAERNLNLMDSRSYAAQGINIEPQLKMGSVATKLERDKYEQELKKAAQAKQKGEVYEIDKTPASQRGTINEFIRERNTLVWNAELAKNRRINERADQIILEGKTARTPFDVPSTPFEPPKPKPKRTEPRSSVSASQSMLEKLRAKKAAQEATERQIVTENQKAESTPDLNSKPFIPKTDHSFSSFGIKPPESEALQKRTEPRSSVSASQSMLEKLRAKKAAQEATERQIVTENQKAESTPDPEPPPNPRFRM